MERKHRGYGDTFYIDEVFVKINGKQHYLWRAVDQDGEVVDVYLQAKRDGVAAKRFFSALLAILSVHLSGSVLSIAPCDQWTSSTRPCPSIAPSNPVVFVRLASSNLFRLTSALILSFDVLVS